MTDRDKDLVLLKSFGGERRLSGAIVGMILICTTVTFVLTFRSPGSLSVLGAVLSTAVAVLIIIQYAVAGPLIRELARLRQELDQLKTNKPSA